MRFRAPSCTGAVAAVVESDTAAVVALELGPLARFVAIASSSPQVPGITAVAVVDVIG